MLICLLGIVDVAIQNTASSNAHPEAFLSLGAGGGDPNGAFPTCAVFDTGMRIYIPPSPPVRI